MGASVLHEMPESAIPSTHLHRSGVSRGQGAGEAILAASADDRSNAVTVPYRLVSNLDREAAKIEPRQAPSVIFSGEAKAVRQTGRISLSDRVSHDTQFVD